MKSCDSKWPVYAIKRKKGIAYCAVMNVGQARSYTKTFPTKIKAINWLKEQHGRAEIDKNTPKFNDYRSNSIKWLCEYWIKTQTEKKIEASSFKKYKGSIDKHIIPHIGNLKFQELTYKRCEIWMERISVKLSKTTTNDTLRLLKQIYNDAVKYELIQSNPIDKVSRYKMEEKEFQFFNFEEKSIFLNYLYQEYPQLYPLFLTALSTGLRSGELQALLWDSVDFTLGQITVKRTFCNATDSLKEQTKTKKIRRVPMNSQLRLCLLELKNNSRKNSLSDYVFPEDTRPKLKRAYVWFKRICREVGVTEIRFHDLRHTFASHFMMAGGGIYDLQKMLGHSSIEMTERYSHLSPGHLKGVTEILSVQISQKENVIDLVGRK